MPHVQLASRHALAATQPPACPLPLLAGWPALQDLKKYARAKELLIMDEEIKKARQVVEDVWAPQ